MHQNFLTLSGIALSMKSSKSGTVNESHVAAGRAVNHAFSNEFGPCRVGKRLFIGSM